VRFRPIRSISPDPLPSVGVTLGTLVRILRHHKFRATSRHKPCHVVSQLHTSEYMQGSNRFAVRVMNTHKTESLQSFTTTVFYLGQ
jgi:hypothetical protein